MKRFGTSFAADVPPMSPVAPPPPPMAAGFNWAGPYVGVYGGGMFGNAIFLGANAGYAVQFGSFVASIEGAIGTAFGGPPVHMSAWARFGPTIGDRTWLYGLLGTSNYGNRELGGGIARAINDNVSIRADVTIYCCWSPIMIRVGANFHLGN
jgi:hypothetical protein